MFIDKAIVLYALQPTHLPNPPRVSLPPYSAAMRWVSLRSLHSLHAYTRSAHLLFYDVIVSLSFRDHVGELQRFRVIPPGELRRDSPRQAAVPRSRRRRRRRVHVVVAVVVATSLRGVRSSGRSGQRVRIADIVGDAFVFGASPAVRGLGAK